MMIHFWPAQGPPICRAGADADDVVLPVAQEVRKEGAHRAVLGPNGAKKC